VVIIGFSVIEIIDVEGELERIVDVDVVFSAVSSESKKNLNNSCNNHNYRQFGIFVFND